MAKDNWNEVTVEDVIKAIRLFDSENPEYPQPRSTFLVFEGKKYPAKHIRGMAYKVHFGKEISKGDYSGGQETIRFFSKLGFDICHIVEKDKTCQISVKEINKVKKEKSNEKDVEDRYKNTICQRCTPVCFEEVMR